MTQRRPPSFSKRKALSIFLLSMMALSFLMFWTPTPAHAGAVVVKTCTTQSGGIAVLSCVFSGGVTAGDVIIVIDSSDRTICGNPVITDSQGNTATTFLGFSVPSANIADSGVTFIASSTGAETVTATCGAAGNFDIAAYEVNGINPGPVQATGGGVDSITAATGTSLTFNTGDFLLGVTVTDGYASSSLPNGFSKVAGTQFPNDQFTYYAIGNVGTDSSPTNFPLTITGGAEVWVVKGFVFTGSPVSTITTSTATTATTRVGDGSITGTTTSIVRGTLYFDQAQNVGVPSTAYNMTMKIKDANIATSTASVFMGLYSTGNSSPPTAGNPLTLVYSHAFIVSNATGITLLSFDIPAFANAIVCPSCYYAVAFLTNANKSNSATVTNSGVQVYQSTGSVGPWFTIGTGQNTLPNSFYTGFGPNPGWYAYILFRYTVAIITVTTTTSGTFFTTVTVTSTSINTPGPTTMGFWFVPMMFMLLGIAGTTAIGAGYGKASQTPLEGSTFAFLVMLGLCLGSWFGTLANITPLGLSLLFSAVVVVMVWRR